MALEFLLNTTKPKKKREEIMEEKKIYKLRIDGVGHHSSQALVMFGASDGEVLKFLEDIESLVLGIGEVRKNENIS